jgi:hypothetical protein
VIAWILSAVPSQVNAQEIGKMLRDSKTFVAQIVAEENGNKTYGTGVLINDGTRLVFVTSLHTVAGADSVFALPAIAPNNKIALDAIGIWPELDLVVLAPRTSLPKSMSPATISTTSVAEGDTIFSIGYPAGLGYTINSGIVTGLRVFQDLPSDLQGGRPLAPQSTWIETNLFVDSRNSGGPLLNAENELIGINTFGGNNTTYTNSVLEGREINKGTLFTMPMDSISVDMYRSLERGKILTLNSADADTNDPKTIQLESREATGPGYLQLNGPAGAEVHINGITFGFIPEEGGEVYVSGLSIGRNDIEFRKQGFASVFNIFTLDKHTAYAELNDPGNMKQIPTAWSHLTIRTIPIDALVTVAGPSQGTFNKDTPVIDLDGIPAGDYNVRVSREGKTLSSKVNIGHGSKIMATFNFINDEIKINNIDISETINCGMFSTDSAYREHCDSAPRPYGWWQYGLFESVRVTVIEFRDGTRQFLFNNIKTRNFNETYVRGAISTSPPKNLDKYRDSKLEVNIYNLFYN